MFRSLWFKLAVCFTVLTMFSITVLAVLPQPIVNHLRFRENVVPQTIADIVRPEQLLLAEGIEHPETDHWFALVERDLTKKLLRLVSHDGQFHIDTIARPELFYRVIDNDGQQVFAYPRPPADPWPARASEVFASHATPADASAEEAVALAHEGHIWISQPVVDGDGKVWGRIDLLYIAEFDAWVNVRNVFAVYREMGLYIVAFFSLIGLVCGLFGNWFVTGQLRRMNVVTAVWREGDLTPRIPVHPKSHDILAQHSRLLNAMADELAALLAQRQRAAVAEERTRVARELHDTIKQNLFALRLQLAAVQHKNPPPDIATHIEEARQITHEAQQDIMGILAQLGPPVAGGQGLYERLAAVADDMRRRFNLELVWARRDVLPATPEEERALLRITQEAIGNAARHGKATRLTLDAFCADGMNHWTLTDNGQGLPAGPLPSAGLGLAFMRSRAKELPEGRFDIANGSKGGVVVAIQWKTE